VTPQTGTALLVLVAFVLPGFVALRYAERTYITRAEESAFERLLSALYFSLLSYVVIVAGAILLVGLNNEDVGEIWDGKRDLGVYLALVGAGVVVPLAIAELARRWSGSKLRRWVLGKGGVSPAHQTPSGWEHFFLQGRWAYVRATLKDGRVVAGFFGPGSFAGYSADVPDLYLERRYQLDEKDWFGDAAPGTLGVYIRADEIVSVEFYDAGQPEARPSMFRRMVDKIRGDAGRPDTDAGSAAADPQEGRDLAGGPVAQPGATSQAAD
jgi:hypothetical protein